MDLQGQCRTTAMGIMPHTDIKTAIDLAMTMDIPFWPQLPKVNFYEDMYVQITENFPGITIDEKNLKINFSLDKFYDELNNYAENMDNDDYFALTGQYSVVYHEFLNRPGLDQFYAIRGQSIGPVSFGLKITDPDKKPIIYNPEIKDFIYDIMAKKLNVQFKELQAKNKNAFVWVDEPGLAFIFGSFTGYTGSSAVIDYQSFLRTLEGPKGIHLCGNPDWDFLLKDLTLDILSMDIYTNGDIFVKYVEDIKHFLERGGIISWGITPTLTEELTQENFQTMIDKMEASWNFLDKHGIDKELILQQAWLAPSRCCLVNADGTKSVAESFRLLRELSAYFKAKYNLL